MVGATPEQLLRAHLTERDDIARRGDFHWDKQPTMEKYLVEENSFQTHVQSVIKNWKTIPIVFHLLTYKYKKHDWWLGELKNFPKTDKK